MKILNYLFLIIFSLSFSFEAFSETRKMEYRCEKVPETGARGFYRFFDIKLTSNGFYGEAKYFSKRRNKNFIQTFTGETAFSGHFEINSRILSENRKPVTQNRFVRFDKSSQQNINLIKYLNKGVRGTQGPRFCTLRLLPNKQIKIDQKVVQKENNQKELAAKKAEEERKQKELAAKKAEEERKQKALASKKAEEEKKRKELAAKKAEEKRKQKELVAKKAEYKSISKIFIEDLKVFVKKPNNLDILKVGELLANYNSYQKSTWNFNKVKAFDDLYKYALNDKNFKRFYNKNNKEREKIILKARKGIIIYLENSLETIKNYISKNLGTSAANDAILIAKKINNSLKKIDEKGSINLIEEINQWKSLNKIEDGHKLNNEAVELIIDIKAKIAEKQKELASKKAEEEKKRKELAAKKAEEERKQKELAAKKAEEEKNKQSVKNFLIGLCVTPSKENFDVCEGKKGKEEFMPSNYFNKSSSINILFFKALEYKAVYKVISENKVHHTIIFPDNCNSTFQYELKNKRLFKTGLYMSKQCPKKSVQAFKKRANKPEELFYKRISISKSFYKDKTEKYEEALKRSKREKIKKSKFKTGINYTNYSDGSCKNSKTTVCISKTDYKYLCKKSKNITIQARSNFGAFYSGDYARFISKNGNLGNLEIKFEEPNYCKTSFIITGFYKGSSQFKLMRGRASVFVLTKSGQVLVHYIHSN